MDKVALVHILSEYLGSLWQISFQQLLHTHGHDDDDDDHHHRLSSGVGK
jgi:hypothetical protein